MGFCCAKKHGIPPFKLGNLIRDARLIQDAKQAAEDLLQRDPALKAPEHRTLQQAVQKQWGDKWPLGITG